MKLTGTYNGKPIELELTEEQIEVLKQGEKKKTGRCGECKNWNGGDCYRQELTIFNDFCSYFEPREE